MSRPENPERLWAFCYTNGRANWQNGAAEVLVRADADKAWVDGKHANCQQHDHIKASKVEEYILASSAALAQDRANADLREELKHAYASVSYEQERVTWLCAKNDRLEGKLAEMEVAATPEVYENLAIQRARHAESMRMILDLEAARAGVRALRGECDDLCARLANTIAWAERETAFANQLKDERDKARDEVARLRRDLRTVREERDRLATLGWAAITGIKAMSEISSAMLQSSLADEAARDGDLHEERSCEAQRRVHLTRADELDTIAMDVLRSDEAAYLKKGATLCLKTVDQYVPLSQQSMTAWRI